MTGPRLSRLPGVDMALLDETVAKRHTRVQQTAESVAAEHAASFSSSATYVRLVSALLEQRRSKAQ